MLTRLTRHQHTIKDMGLKNKLYVHTWTHSLPNFTECSQQDIHGMQKYLSSNVHYSCAKLLDTTQSMRVQL